MADENILGDYGDYSVGQTISGGIDASGDWETTNQQGSYDYPQDDWATVNQQGSYDYPSDPQKIFIAGDGVSPNYSGWSSLGDTKNTPSKPLWDSSSSSGSRSYSTGASSPQYTTSTRTPTTPMPTITKTDPYTNPTWSKDQIKSYAQEDSALGISEARDALYNSVNKIVSMQGNPTAQAAAMREALKGHGSAIAQTMRGANKEALARYQMQYQYQVNEAILRFNTIQNQAQMKYNAEMQAYLASMQTTNTTGYGTPPVPYVPKGGYNA
jgi:hypothetical protein